MGFSPGCQVFFLFFVEDQFFCVSYTMELPCVRSPIINECMWCTSPYVTFAYSYEISRGISKYFATIELVCRLQY